MFYKTKRILAYDAGTSPSSVKVGGGGNFLAVTTDVSGTTGVDGNVTIGVVAGNLRIENRSGSLAYFRYFFLG
ncbi:hypothetical protein O8B94_07485 [Agrobacterium rhizogenes]|uniref:hypothetical protein n=1 Tax=Rhizobium/Agrobacterium group TaxID=227290 RepID=UPI0013C2FC2B|nr:MULTISPECIES: hypothetical protein [Rhizobium/Agrobacterium group]MCZ7442391.1 hypothetical protein [Rhizobium rhizogenes]